MTPLDPISMALSGIVNGISSIAAGYERGQVEASEVAQQVQAEHAAFTAALDRAHQQLAADRAAVDAEIAKLPHAGSRDNLIAVLRACGVADPVGTADRLLGAAHG